MFQGDANSHPASMSDKPKSETNKLRMGRQRETANTGLWITSLNHLAKGGITYLQIFCYVR